MRSCQDGRKRSGLAGAWKDAHSYAELNGQGLPIVLGCLRSIPEQDFAKALSCVHFVFNELH